MDYLYRQGYLSVELTKPNAATAEGWLTYEEANALASQISERLDGYVKITKQNRTKHFPKEQWWLLYEEILKDTDPEGTVETKNLQIYATPQNVEYLTAWTAYTNDGTYGFDGLSLDAYIDREIRVRLRNHEIITVIEKASDEVQYRNVWVASAKPGELEVYWGKAKRTFVAEKSFKKPEDMIHQVADISMVNGELRKITLKKERISGKVLAVLDTSIELEGYGEIPLEENFSVYKIYGDFKVQKKSDILVGYEIQEFVVANGKLCSALTVREFQAERIRVLLMNNGFQSIFHDQVTLRLNSAATLTVGKKEIKMNSGDTLTITPNDERLRAGRMILTPEDETQGIAVESLERAQGIPYYPGRLEIKQGQDGLLLVNDLYLEDYLKRVVPSEMPGSYEKEALKAQAVCARTYAYRQIRGNTYMQYGAHIDDSTRVQVFNNIRTDEKTDIAVNETYGKLLMYQDSVLEAYYFSTSCGHTTD
ncbi:MAG: SpoIID/LytB domain-containing protein, partial [Hungatella sp.]